jgi:hypothetical protein
MKSRSSLRLLSALVTLSLAYLPLTSQAAVSIGGFAIVGFTDHDSISLPDSTVGDTFSIAAMEDITAGTVVYFTGNGWSSSGFRGANASATNGAGLEGLIKLTITTTVAAGSVLRSGFDDVGITWDYTSLVPGTDASNSLDYYSLLPLPGSGAGGQIYGFQSSSSNNPLYNVSNHIFVFDMGDFVSPGFENAVDSATGNIPPGLSLMGNSAIEFPDLSSAINDPNDFHNGSFALNMFDTDVAALLGTGGTKAQWLALIADPSNWLRYNLEDLGVGPNDGDAEDELAALNFTMVPEPSRAMLVLIGLCGMFLRRRR